MERQQEREGGGGGGAILIHSILSLAANEDQIPHPTPHPATQTAAAILNWNKIPVHVISHVKVFIFNAV